MSDASPTLAQLRRRKRAASSATPSLFDLPTDLPENSPDFDHKTPQKAPDFIPQSVEPPRPPAENTRIWTVAELMRRMRGVVEEAYGRVIIEGEISNWRPASSGHCYFTLKDGNAQLAIVMFRSQAQLLRFRPKDGDSVRIYGNLTVYESRGQMQLVAERMQQVGLGALLAATRELKERLRAEGLFDRKRPIPEFPHTIGVITSLEGAVLRDIVRVARRRHPGLRLLVLPSTVQGPDSPRSVVQALQWFSQNPQRADAIILARGGGSWEDLHGFDHEDVVRAIAASVLPVVTGIGHATDSTLADSAADACAPTPSAAAELLTSGHHRIEEQVEALERRLLRATRFELLRQKQRFLHIGFDHAMRSLRDRVLLQMQRLDEAEDRYKQALALQVRQHRSHLSPLRMRLLHASPHGTVVTNTRVVQQLSTRLSLLAPQLTLKHSWRLRQAEVQLRALNPTAILQRGYALVYDSNGKLVQDASTVHSGQGIVARVAKGRIRARVEYSE